MRKHVRMIERKTIDAIQPICDICKRDIFIGERIDESWKHSEAIYIFEINKEVNRTVGGGIKIDLCVDCFQKSIEPFLRSVGIDTKRLIT